MRISLQVILVTGIFGGFFGEKICCALPVPEIINKDLDFDQMYKSYVSISVSNFFYQFYYYFLNGDFFLEWSRFNDALR